MTEQQRTLGVIGGLGPMATAYFMELAVKMTDAERDQDHLEMVIFNSPSIPDRTAHILDPDKPSPVPPILALARKLEALGASCIAIPCITSHYFFGELQPQVKIPFLNIVEETAAHLKENGVKKAGIMATTGTVRTRLFQNALARQGLDWAAPDEAHQKLVMDIIYNDVKAGQPVERDKLDAVYRHLRDQGAQYVILGCTELSVAKRHCGLGSGYLDALEVLARASVLACGKPLRREYQRLL